MSETVIVVKALVALAALAAILIGAWRLEGATDGLTVQYERAGSVPVLDAVGAADMARSGVLLDARTPERFRGESEPIDRVAGRVPGSVNLPIADLLDTDGRFLPPEQIRSEVFRLL